MKKGGLKMSGAKMEGGLYWENQRRFEDSSIDPGVCYMTIFCLCQIMFSGGVWIIKLPQLGYKNTYSLRAIP